MEVREIPYVRNGGSRAVIQPNWKTLSLAKNTGTYSATYPPLNKSEPTSYHAAATL
jgi:hypothetical protein